MEKEKAYINHCVTSNSQIHQESRGGKAEFRPKSSGQSWYSWTDSKTLCRTKEVGDMNQKEEQEGRESDDFLDKEFF